MFVSSGADGGDTSGTEPESQELWRRADLKLPTGLGLSSGADGVAGFTGVEGEHADTSPH